MSAWPQYVVLALLFSQLVAHLVKDQKEQSKSVERATSVLASFAVFAIFFGLLWAGGFWAAIGLPSQETDTDRGG